MCFLISQQKPHIFLWWLRICIRCHDFDDWYASLKPPPFNGRPHTPRDRTAVVVNRAFNPASKRTPYRIAIAPKHVGRSGELCIHNFTTEDSRASPRTSAPKLGHQEKWNHGLSVSHNRHASDYWVGMNVDEVML
jgi:hypothetical protein